MAAAGDITYIEDVTALVDASAPIMVRKTADESVTSSVTLQDDNELVLAVAANSVYFVEGWIIYSAASNAPDLRANWTKPAGATWTYCAWGAPNASTTASDTVDTSIQTGDVGRGAGTAFRTLIVKGELTVGATAGNLQFQFAQVTSDAGAITVKASSRLMAWKYS